MTITIGSEQVPTFEEDGKFFCRYCQSYSRNFYPSYVKYRKRECKDCIRQRKHQRNSDPLVNLRFKLYQALYDRGAIPFARAISTKHVTSILKSHCVDDPRNVKRIRVPEKQELWDDLSKYEVEYK